MNIIKGLFILCTILRSNAQYRELIFDNYQNIDEYNVPNNCITFTVSQGTGCQWMCEYCANSLDTNNYYFTTDVCKYESSGCVGNPQVGVSYSCCSL